jgi:ADP-dependent phosphofructokinase/glucokinase
MGFNRFILSARHRTFALYPNKDIHKFEVEDALCADGAFYHLGFDEDLRLVEKRMHRKALDGW